MGCVTGTEKLLGVLSVMALQVLGVVVVHGTICITLRVRRPEMLVFVDSLDV